MKQVIAYTDGACHGNPGPGGWGVVLKSSGCKKELQGGQEWTTNNRMEMQAAVEALRSLREPCEVKIVTDSTYLKNGMQSWLDGWKRKGWKTSGGKPVKNQDLWKELDELVATHRVYWHWVRGHSGVEGNERADALANEAIIQVVKS